MSAFQLPIRYGRDNELWIRTGSPLGERWVETPNPLFEQVRQYYGTALTPEAIEQTIVRADCGFMRDLTDLEYETTRMDPHWSMCDGKRLRACAGIKPKVVQAETFSKDDEKDAKLFADVVRQQMSWLGNTRQMVLRLNWGHKNGRAAAEKVWQENRGTGALFKWRIDHINWIHPRRLSFGPERELRVRDDMWGGYGWEKRGLELREYPHKFIGFLPQLFNEYPEREGYAPRALFHSFFKRLGWREQMTLLEVFGRPWRIIGVAEGQTVDGETLKKAAESIDFASANATIMEPANMKLRMEQPEQGAGQVHSDVKQDANDEISKLILGEVRTSDAKPGAIGSQGEAVALELQSEVKAEDCSNLSDLLTEGIAASVISLNFGADKLHLCPRIELPYELPPDRTVEIDRTAKAFSMGVPLVEDEVYERIGFKKPAEGDTVIQQQAGPPGPMGQPGKPTTTQGTMPAEGDEPNDPATTDTDEPDDAAPTLTAPPSDYLLAARTMHVLDLAAKAAQGDSARARVVRRRIPKAKKKPEE